VCNHLGFFEIIGLVCSPLCPGFSPKSEMRNIPGIGKMAIAMDSIFINRGANEEERK
jgi:1-acyl-sn-glycerol-3-phosphate acyltransferase